MIKPTQMDYATFREFYQKHRDRFKFCERRRFDETFKEEATTETFTATVDSSNEDYQAIKLVWVNARRRESYEFPLYWFTRYVVTGNDAMLAIAELSGLMDALNPKLNDALMSLVDDDTPINDLILNYHHAKTGRLLYLKATRGNGLIQVMASLPEVE